MIPTRKDQKRRPGFDKLTYRRRNVVERCIGWLKDRRRLATRFEKLAENFLAMVKLAMLERLPKKDYCQTVPSNPSQLYLWV